MIDSIISFLMDHIFSFWLDIVIGLLRRFFSELMIKWLRSVPERLVRYKSSRLPSPLSERMREEWLAELGFIVDPLGRLRFAVALFRQGERFENLTAIEGEHNITITVGPVTVGLTGVAAVASVGDLNVALTETMKLGDDLSWMSQSANPYPAAAPLRHPAYMQQPVNPLLLPFDASSDPTE